MDIYTGVSNPNNTFNNIKPQPRLDIVVNAFTELLKDSPKFKMLMVYGNIGNGKTMCCEALVLALNKKGIKARRDRWGDLVRELKSRFNSTSGAYEDYYNRLKRRQWLILDDVGCGTSLGVWELGELEDLVDYRMEQIMSGANMYTVITTNMDIKDLPERIISRFRDKTVARLVLNEAADYRPKK